MKRTIEVKQIKNGRNYLVKQDNSTFTLIRDEKSLKCLETGLKVEIKSLDIWRKKEERKPLVKFDRFNW